MCNNVKPKNYSQLYTSPLWYNPLISEYPLFFRTLYHKGIYIVGDLLNNEGEIITKDEILNINITTAVWGQIYKVCFKTLKDNYLIYLQYKIINQILGTRSLLYKMSITTDKYCSFCKEHEETLSHLFYDCNQVLLPGKSYMNGFSTKPTSQLQTRIKTQYETLEFISIKNNEQGKFNRNWNTFKALFD